MYNFMRFFLHTLEALTLDLIPMYFRRYLTFNADKSGVFNDARKMLRKKSETVFFPKDSDVNEDEFMKDLNSLNYFRNFNSSIFAHIVTIFIIAIVSPSIIVGIVLYLVLSVAVKFLATIVQAVIAIATKSHELSEDRLVLTVDAGLAQHSTGKDRENATSMYDTITGADGLDNVSRVKRNSEKIQSRQI